MPEDVPENDGELRRRAAWLLGMLVLVAILIVIVMSFLLNRGDGSSDSQQPLGDDPITATAPVSGSSAPSSAGSSTSPTTAAPTTRSSGPSSSASAGTSSLPTGPKTCPGSDPCALSGDTGNAAAALTAYLTSHGRKAVPVSVTPAAQKCALNRGDGCDGGWAETELSDADGKAAVQKISQFAKLTTTSYSSIDIGWAYDPGSKSYYFVTIRQS